MSHAAKPRWTEQMMLDALSMRDAGVSMAQIACRLGVSRSAVCGILKRIADDEARAEGE